MRLIMIFLALAVAVSATFAFFVALPFILIIQILDLFKTMNRFLNAMTVVIATCLIGAWVLDHFTPDITFFLVQKIGLTDGQYISQLVPFFYSVLCIISIIYAVMSDWRKTEV